ncbi:MAG: NAD(P)H-hydrate dehydratase [Candidatus Omnitrophota bacterium]|nr:NAD(P)H-hydrate dehydratase [Candidatus Omnitrophota bacterium]
MPTQLLHRKADSHKGDFGHIFILAGSLRYSGAAILTSNAAMRSGAGLVTLGVPKTIAPGIIKTKTPEVMILPLDETSEGSIGLTAYIKIRDFIKKADVVVVGPGLSKNPSTQNLIRKIIAKTTKPKIIDADGINASVNHLNILNGCVITPHINEFSRLTKIDVARLQKIRKIIAKDFAYRYNAVVVLKGKNTIVTDNTGALYINKTGNPGMATAGSGDVLTGIIAGFIAQGLSLFEASKYAVFLHGLAGDLAKEEKTENCLIASDIIDKIPEAIKLCR